MYLKYLICVLFTIYTVFGVHVSNLSGSCIRCLCHVAGCDMSHGCSGGYCGPFYISKLYWIDAGKPTLANDDPERDEADDSRMMFPLALTIFADGAPVEDDRMSMRSAFEDCARDYFCSIRVIESYMAKYGKDCNNDGVTNCFDFMMINYHGGRACSDPLFLSPQGLRWLAKFEECRF